MRPALQLDFARAGLLDPRTVFTRASGAVVRRPGSGWREVPAGAPGFHHDTDGRLLGVPIEPARTNQVRNPRCAGAVVGVVRDGAALAGPGALPTNWSWTDNGNVAPGANALTLEVTANTWPGGGDGFVYRLSGTPTNNVTGGNFLNFDSRTQIAGGTDRTWAVAVEVMLVAGSISGINLGGPNLSIERAAAGGNQLGGDIGSVALGPVLGVPRRVSILRTFGVDPARVVGAIRHTWTAGVPVDMTLAVRFSQVEAGPYASLPILPPAGAPAASTRAVAVVSANIRDWGLLSGLTSGTLLISGNAPPAAVSAEILRFDDGTNDNGVVLRRNAGRSFSVDTWNGGVLQGATGDTAAVADNARFVAAIGFAPDDVALSVNGAAPVLGTMVSPGANLSRLFVGGSSESAVVSRVAYWPRRLPNAELQLLGA